MRALLFVALALVCTAADLGCDQDYAASNAERESFMGDVQAAPPAMPASASASASAAPPPPTPAPSVSAPPTPPASAALPPAAKPPATADAASH